MGTTSRFRKYFRTTLRKRKRKIKVWGVDEDTGKYIRCWNCGFIVNVDRDLGDPDRNGTVFSDVVMADLPPPHREGYDDQQYVTAMSDTLDMKSTLIDPAQDIQYTPRLSTVVRGCPLCGCTNL